MRFFILIAVILLAIGGYTGYWFYIAHAVETGIAEWLDDQESRGNPITVAPLAFSGYPYRLHVHAPAIEAASAFAGKNGSSTLRWQAPPLDAVMQPWNPLHVIFQWPGPHRLVGQYQDRPLDVALATETLRGSYRTDQAGLLQRLSVNVTELRAEETTTRAKLHSKEAEFHVRNAPGGQGTEVFLTIPAAEVTLPQDLLLGPLFQNLRLEAVLSAPLPASATPADLVQWQQAGGKITINRAEAQWGSIGFQADGQLNLDADLHLNGRLDAKVDDHSALLKALVDKGHVPADNAEKVGLALSLLALANNGVLKIPVLFKAGWVHAGPFKLGRLQSLHR